MYKSDLDTFEYGSDFHGLVQRVAFFLWLGCGNHEKLCWDEAKLRVAQAGNRYSYKYGDPESLHKCLSWDANQMHYETPWQTENDNWDYALTTNAELVLTSTKRLI